MLVSRILSLHSYLQSDTVFNKLKPPHPHRSPVAVSSSQPDDCSLLAFPSLHGGPKNASTQKAKAVVRLTWVVYRPHPLHPHRDCNLVLFFI